MFLSENFLRRFEIADFDQPQSEIGRGSAIMSIDLQSTLEVLERFCIELAASAQEVSGA